MEQIARLAVQHVRVHELYDLTISPNVTLITGANGSGKTSLIEALYIALQGSSFKGSDSDVLQQGASWYRIDVSYTNGGIRTVKFDPSRPSGKKQFIIDTKTNYRLLEKYKYPIVLFEPDDLRLLHGSPTRRRQFIDRFIAQLDPQYAVSLRRYERALKQRNALLKRDATSSSMFAWDVALSEHGAYITQQRATFAKQLNERLNAVYEAIAHTHDVVSVAYPFDTSAQHLLTELHRSSERDALLGYTSVGPHRHDVLFEFNNSPALSVASRGEVRSIVLALKFLEVEIIEALTGKNPVILLDDVFSELDKERQNYLVDLTKKNQIIITSATNNSNLHTNYVTEL
ncbi:MAG TPA: DNA replication and repair protein RecF [Candidatus Saccharimonadales bacterium]